MKKSFVVLLLNLGLIGFFAQIVRGESPATAPEELTNIVEEIEAAANDRDLKRLASYYSDDFTNNDGLTKQTLTKALKQMWQRYPQLQYTTEIESWSSEDGRLVADTKTTIEGMQNGGGRKAQLSAIVKSRQYFEGEKLVSQKILAEQSQLISGSNPPTVEIFAPEMVKVGEKYSFDLIVDEPLGDRIMLGAVKEEKTAGNLYLNPTALELEQLPAGGIYRVATAPLLPESNWLSAILVRGDGIVMINHRVNVEEKAAK